MQNLAVSEIRKVVYLSVDKIIANPYQPRNSFNKISLEELARSIQKYGILQPLNVRQITNNLFELVSGERRLRAARLAGLKEIPVIIINISNRESAAIALVENIQRENLSFFEEAEGYQNLMVEFGYTQEEIAAIVAKRQSTIANKLRILKLSFSIKSMIKENNLTERHARALLKLEDENLQEEVLKKVIKYGLNVAKTEELIEQTLKKLNGEEEKPQFRIQYKLGDIRFITNSFKETVDMIREAGIKTDYQVEKNGNEYEIKIKVVL